MKKYIITQDQANKVINYLAEKPVKEVIDIFNVMMTLKDFTEPELVDETDKVEKSEEVQEDNNEEPASTE